jgi:signal transduction histidine kinase
MRAFSAIAVDTKHMYNFQLLSIAEIGKAMETASRLQRVLGQKSFGASPEATPQTVSSLVEHLEAFDRRYRREWETADGTTPDAARFRDQLLGGDAGLLEKERRALMNFEEALQVVKANPEGVTPEGETQLLAKAVRVNESIAALYDVNVGYAALAHQHVAEHAARARTRLLIIGISGTGLTLLLGLLVHRAIAPRIQRLVRKVHRFREFGVNEKIVETGKDEIAILSNALDAGFSAIAAREQEREQFLAVAAHELKTPITSIQGYASLLLQHPEKTALLPRALEVIHRQAWRLSRLVENLFLAMRARTGKLEFAPKPLDLSELVEQSLAEIRPFTSAGAFSTRIAPQVRILGDQALLEHALLSLFTCSLALSPPDSPIKVALEAGDSIAKLSVDVQGAVNSAQEIEELFIPFRTVQFESGSGIRAAVRLYLCREIVKVHNGQLRVFDVNSQCPEFLMELPI